MCNLSFVLLWKQKQNVNKKNGLNPNIISTSSNRVPWKSCILFIFAKEWNKTQTQYVRSNFNKPCFTFWPWTCQYWILKTECYSSQLCANESTKYLYLFVFDMLVIEKIKTKLNDYWWRRLNDDLMTIVTTSTRMGLNRKHKKTHRFFLINNFLVLFLQWFIPYFPYTVRRESWFERTRQSTMIEFGMQ